MTTVVCLDWSSQSSELYRTPLRLIRAETCSKPQVPTLLVSLTSALQNEWATTLRETFRFVIELWLSNMKNVAQLHTEVHYHGKAKIQFKAIV